ncbi:MAG TPA: hypothetical protein VH877_33230 [Polyangia bacterium]|jgi:hypothetical protein|nr:hypothetical protein [Polyangia bacterium]
MFASSLLLAALMSSLPVAASAPPERPQCLTELEAWTLAELAPMQVVLAPGQVRAALDILSSCIEDLEAGGITPAPAVAGCADGRATVWIEFVHACSQPRLVRLALVRAAHKAPVSEPPSCGRAATPTRPGNVDDHSPPVALLSHLWSVPLGATRWVELPSQLPPSAESERLERPPRAGLVSL